MGKIIGLTFPEQTPKRGIEPAVLNVLPPGDNVEFSMGNSDFNNFDVDMFLCSVYTRGFPEFRRWAEKHNREKIIVGGYHPTSFPEEFLDLAGRVVVGPCDDIESTLSQEGVLFVPGYHAGGSIDASYVKPHILRTLPKVKGWIRTKGERILEPESVPEGVPVIKDWVLPGVLTFSHSPRRDLYDIRNNGRVIPGMKLEDIVTGINTSYGCTMGCDFCSTPSMYGGRMISKPLVKLEEDVEMISSLLRKSSSGATAYLFVQDENFMAQRDYYERLEVLDKIGAKIILYSSANLLTEEKVEQLSKRNVYLVKIGLEDPTAYYSKNRRLNEAVSQLKSKGILCELSFIVDYFRLLTGNPDSTAQEERISAFFNGLYGRLIELKPEMIVGNFLVPFPDTEVWDRYSYMFRQEDYERINHRIPFLIRDPLLRDELDYKMFEVQWRYFTSDEYNHHVRQFDVGDTLHKCYMELRKKYDELSQRIMERKAVKLEVE